MNFNQMFNSLYHNQENQAIKREANNIKEIWDRDPHQRVFLKNNNPDLAAALESGDMKKLENIIGEKIKA